MLRNFTNLEELSLPYVNISSVLPTSLNISSSLKLLDLSSTGLQGNLPHYIFNLQYLETLDLSHNQFTGDIPSKIPMNLTHLTNLNLLFNNLNGTLPYWLFTSPSLEYLDLSYNMFSGNVPFESFALPSLKRLDLSHNNHLSGQIDMQTFRQLTNLTYLDLSYKYFSGEWELDTLLSCLTNLEYLDLSYSGFSVTTNNGYHYVNPGFRFLKLASCKLKVFPESFRAMKQLQHLDLSGNEIHGQIPHWAGEIGRNELYLLNLSHNFITVLPQFQWYGLGELYLQSNLIEGPFPPSICNMSGLGFLDMSHNSFDGVIPQCVGNISNSLQMMDLGNNSFQGTIPNVFEEFKNLFGLILNGNQLEGGVPSFLGLQVLDLSYNSFVGQLPTKYFQNFDSMKNVVKDNTEPEYLEMGGGNYYSFVVAVKGVYQDIPRLFVSLTIIDLSNNYFERGIPEIIGSLNSLKVLNLSHNCLNGRIPDSLGKLSEIESLDLSWNHLTGNIPQSLAGIKGLAVLDLSQNHLVGAYSRGTHERTHKPQLEEHENHEDKSGFTWEAVTLGYGCGTLLGLGIAYGFRAKQEKICIYREMTATLLKVEEFREARTFQLFRPAADMDFGDIDFSKPNMGGGDGFYAEDDRKKRKLLVSKKLHHPLITKSRQQLEVKIQ
ncbi:leucine-rich repeat-containing protein [Tanacetum coccineum]